MGTLKNEIQTRLTNMEKNLDIKKRKGELLETIGYKIDEVEKFISKEHDTFKDMLEVIETVRGFNIKNGTNIDFNVEDILRFGLSDDGNRMIKFFTHKGIYLSVELDKNNGELLSTLKFEDNKDCIRCNMNFLMEGVKFVFEKLEIGELQHIENLIFLYMKEIHNRLSKYNRNASLEEIFINIAKNNIY